MKRDLVRYKTLDIYLTCSSSNFIQESVFLPNKQTNQVFCSICSFMCLFDFCGSAVCALSPCCGMLMFLCANWCCSKKQCTMLLSLHPGHTNAKKQPKKKRSKRKKRKVFYVAGTGAVMVASLFVLASTSSSTSCSAGMLPSSPSAYVRTDSVLFSTCVVVCMFVRWFVETCVCPHYVQSNV